MSAQRSEGRFHYAAKVICGQPRESRGSVRLAQTYWTVVNIHNPSDSLALIAKSLVLTIPPDSQRPGAPRRVAVDSLPPLSALSTDCADLRARLRLPSFFDGFVVIDSWVSLDVVAVYSVPGGIDVERVAERIR